jgi:hypothetical protein
MGEMGIVSKHIYSIDADGFQPDISVPQPGDPAIRRLQGYGNEPTWVANNSAGYPAWWKVDSQVLYDGTTKPTGCHEHWGYPNNKFWLTGIHYQGP